MFCFSYSYTETNLKYVLYLNEEERSFYYQYFYKNETEIVL